MVFYVQLNAWNMIATRQRLLKKVQKKTERNVFFGVFPLVYQFRSKKRHGSKHTSLTDILKWCFQSGKQSFNIWKNL